MEYSKRHKRKVSLKRNDQGTGWGDEEAGEVSRGQGYVRLRANTLSFR